MTIAEIKARLEAASKNAFGLSSFQHHAKEDIIFLLGEVDALVALIPDPDKMLLLAEWLDKRFPNDKKPEVQEDLRRWARAVHRHLFPE